MLRLFMRDHAPVMSVSKELLTWVAVISLTSLASSAWADPQSEISVYRKSHGFSAVTEDAKLTELARQQANAMAERRSMDHNVYASFSSRIPPYGSASAAENIAMGTKTFAETLTIWKSSSGHNANLLKPNVRDGTTYWALILAAQPQPPQPKPPRRNVRVLSIFFRPSYCSEWERPEPLLISLGDEVADEG
jgi:hypothetical protein